MRRGPNNPVKEARLRQLLSITALAAKAGVSYDVARDANHGVRIGELSQERIAQALGLPRGYLFPDEPTEATG